MASDKYLGIKSKLKKVGSSAGVQVTATGNVVDEEQDLSCVLTVPDLFREIASHLDLSETRDLRTLRNMGSVCRATVRLWRPLIVELPQRISPNLTDSILSTMPNLTSLDLWQNTKVNGEGLKSLKNLKSLVLKGNTTISDESISHMVGLTSLDLSSTKLITDAPVQNFTNLTTLKLNINNSITPASVSKLTNLVRLELSRNNLIDGDTIVKLRSLRELNLSYNSYIQDHEFRKFTQISSADLRGNKTISDSAVVSLIGTLHDFKGRGWLT